MEAADLVEELKKRLPKENFDWQFDRQADKLRIVHHTLHKGMDISLPEILSKYEQKKDRAIDEVVYTIQETFRAMEQEQEKGFAGEIQSILSSVRLHSQQKVLRDNLS